MSARATFILARAKKTNPIQPNPTDRTRRYVTVHSEPSACATSFEVSALIRTLKMVVASVVSDGVGEGVEFVRRFCDLEMIEACVWDWWRLAREIMALRESDEVQRDVIAVLAARNDRKLEEYLQKQKYRSNWAIAAENLAKKKEKREGVMVAEIRNWIYNDFLEDTEWVK